jgi:hypothetical protein
VFLVAFSACQVTKTQTQGIDINVEDRYLTQEEMTELVTYVWDNGEKVEEIGRYSRSSFDLILEDNDEIVAVASLVFIYDLVDEFAFADGSGSAEPFVMLGARENLVIEENKDNEGNIYTVEVRADYVFYASFYIEEKKGYSVKPNRIYYKTLAVEGNTGSIIENRITNVFEYDNNGHDSEDWKMWMEMFYKKMLADREVADEPQ